MTRRLAAMVALAVIAATASACEVRAHRSKVFVTRDARVVVQERPEQRGETIFDIENNDDAKHRLVLVRLAPGQAADSLPVRADGTVDVGRPSEIDFQGDGYQVVEKLDTMRAYFGSGQRIKTIAHTYLRPGTHVLFCNLPGHYEKGELTVIPIGDQ